MPETPNQLEYAFLIHRFSNVFFGLSNGQLYICIKTSMMKLMMQNGLLGHKKSMNKATFK